MNAATIEQLQRVVADSTRSDKERRQAAEHILKLQQNDAALWADIPADDPEVQGCMERVQGEEYLNFWPEYKNRTLDEARQVVYLRRITQDKFKSHSEQWEAENALMAIRRKLRGDS